MAKCFSKGEISFQLSFKRVNAYILFLLYHNIAINTLFLFDDLFIMFESFFRSYKFVKYFIIFCMGGETFRRIRWLAKRIR